MTTSTVIQGIYRFLKKHYFWAMTLAVIVMVMFINDTSVLRQKQMKKDLNELKSAVEHFEVKMEEAELKLKILDDDYELEKFAREHYFMKRDNEDVFVFEEVE